MELDAAMASDGFWDKPDQARVVIGELKLLRAEIDPVDQAARALEDVHTLGELGEEAGADAVEADMQAAIATAQRLLKEIDFKLMLGGEHDHRAAFLTVQTGTGGLDAADFAEMLIRMYLRCGERHGFEVQTLELNYSDEGGLRSGTIEVRGPFAYGYLKAERGVHRLVRVSPYDAQNRRQTSFAAVEVTPEFDDELPISIRSDDLDVGTFRAGGAGGQHVNKTESAIRITHVPTGIVVQCQNERSQHQNRATAMKMLAAKLYELRERERDDELKKLYGTKGEISWGHQIRSYVLNPYQLVKDHRTNHENGNTQAVLDGEIDDFIEEYLRSRSAK
jgi:peptide chain release factor 2